MNCYNGYTPEEREKKLRALHRTFPDYSHHYYRDPCSICSDSTSPVAPHSEDYAEPFLWQRPAMYPVCRTCHSRLHKRLKNPHGWAAYKCHIKRGGYGSDLKNPEIAKEIRLLGTTIERGEPITLNSIRPFTMTDLWWDSLKVDPELLTAKEARPR